MNNRWTSPRRIAEGLRYRYWRYIGVHLSNLGVLGWGDRVAYVARISLALLFRVRTEGSLFPLGAQHPVVARFGSSDLEVFHQIFVQQEYSCVTNSTDICAVLDLGANVGYSSAWFAAEFPDAVVVAVEPDPANAILARRNLLPFGNRVTVIEAAAWTANVELVLDRSFRDGREWAVTVRHARAGELSGVKAFTIPSLMKLSGISRIDILKMDVEGAEERLFRQGAEAWLPSVRNLLVELHDEVCEAACRHALAPFGVGAMRSGELTVYLGLSGEINTK